MNRVKTMLKRSVMLLWLVGVLSCGKGADHVRNQAYALTDGGRAVVFRDGEVRVYDGQGAERYVVSGGNRRAVMGAEGRYLAWQAEGGGTVEVQDLVEGKREVWVGAHLGEVGAFARGEEGFVVLEKVGRVVKLDGAGKVMVKFQGSLGAWPVVMGVSRDGKEAVFAGSGGSVERVSVEGSERTLLEQVQVGGEVEQVAYGREVLAVTTDLGELVVYRRSGGLYGGTPAVYGGTGKVVELGLSEDEKAVWVVNEVGLAQVYAVERPDGLLLPCLRVELSVGVDSVVVRSGDPERLRSQGLFGVLWSGDGAQMEVKNLCTEKTYDPGMGHQSVVTGVGFLGDEEEFVVSGSWDGTLAEWEGKTWRLLRRFVGHTNRVTSLAVSKVGKVMVSGSADGTAKVWKVGERALGAVQVGAEKTFVHGASVWSVAVSPDGTKVVTGGEDGRAKVWDVTTGVLQKTFDHMALVNSVAMFTVQEGDKVVTKLVTGGKDGTAKVWNMSTGVLEKTFDHVKTVRSVAVFTVQEGDKAVTKLVTGGDGAKVWDVSTGDLERTLVYSGVAYGRVIHSVAVSSKGTELLTGGEDGAVLRWSMTEEEKPLQYLESPLQDQRDRPFIYGAAWSKDHRWVLLALFQGAILWNVETREVEQRFEVPVNTNTSAVALSPDGRSVAVGCNDGTVMLWDQNGGSFVPSQVIWMWGPVQSIEFSSEGMLVTDGRQVTDGEKSWNGLGLTFASYAPKGDRVVALNTNAKTVQLLDWSQASPTPIVGSMHKGSAAYTSAKFSPDGKLVYVSSDEGKDLLMSMDGRAVDLPFGTWDVSWLLGGKVVATVTNGRVWLFMVDSLRNATFVPFDTADFFLPTAGGLSVSEDGQTLFAMSSSGVSLRWSLSPIVTQARLSNLR